MVGVVYNNPHELSQGRAALDASRAFTPTNGNFSTDYGAGFLETAGLTYVQESVIGSAIRYGFRPDANASNYSYDREFNPIEYFLKNKETFGDIEYLVRGRKYDDVFSEKQFKDRAERHRLELNDRKRLSTSESTAGMLTGGLLSIADVTTLVPFVGQAKKAKSLYTIGKSALALGATQAGQEFMLHSNQEFRTAEQSATNIALAAAIGGGLGAFASAKDPGNILNPRHKWNPLNPANPISTGFKRYGKALSESEVMRPVKRGGRVVADHATLAAEQLKLREAADAISGMGRSVGAAAVKYGMSPIKSRLSDAAMWLSKNRITGTPVGMMINARSAKARAAALKLMDTNGILMQEYNLGIASGRSVEDIKNLHSSKSEELITKSLERNTELAFELGELVAGGGRITAAVTAAKNYIDDMVNAGAVLPNGIHPKGTMLDDWEFNNITNQQLMYGKLDEYTENALLNRFGQEGLDRIMAKAREQVTDINGYHKALEDEMVASGMITEKQRMGDDYKKAQLWDARGIRANIDGAEMFFYRLLAKDPTEEFLAEYKLTPEQFDKLGKEDVTLTSTVKGPDGQAAAEVLTPEVGNIRKKEILEDWAGDVWDKQITEANMLADAAQHEAKLLRKEAVIMAAELRGSYTEIKNVSIDEAKDTIRLRLAGVEKYKATRERLVAERDKVKAEAQRAQAEAKARTKLNIDEGKIERKLTGQANSQVRQAEKMYRDLAKNPESAPKDVKAGQDLLTETDLKLVPENMAADVKAASDAKRATDPVSSNDIGKYSERVARLDSQIASLDTKIASTESRIKVLSERVMMHENALETARANQALVRKLVKEANKDARHAARVAKRAAKKAKKGEKASGLVTHVQQLVRSLAGHDKVPGKILDQEVFQSGRAKSRQFHLTPEQHREAVQAGFLDDNLYNVIGRTSEDVGTRLGMREAFGLNTSSAEDLKDVFREIDAEYDDLINAATTAGKMKVVSSLQKEKAAIREQLEGVDGRLRGTYKLPDDPDSFGNWILQKARQYNYVRFGAGFLVSSMTDVANVTLTTGFKSLGLDRLRRVLSINAMESDEIRRLAVASERIMHSSRTMKMADIADARGSLGIGEYGSFKHRATSRVDRTLESLTGATNAVSGMSAWNVRMKALAMVEIQHNIAEIMPNYSSLLKAASAGDKAASLEVAKLASLGLGSNEMSAIAKMMAKHPPVKDEGVWELGLSRWWQEGKEGIRAAEDVQIALERAARRAIMTPGVGNTPLFLSGQYAKTLLQFQTYGFVYVNNFLIPTMQRVGAYGDKEALLSFGLQLALGTGVVMAKDLLRHGRIKDRTVDEWSYDILDRSGALAYLSVPLGAAKAQLFGAPPSRYSQMQNTPALLMGPTGGLAADALNAYYNPNAKTLTRIAPFKPLIDLGAQIYK